MPNQDGGMSAALASARWHMKCPLCKQAEGVLTFPEIKNKDGQAVGTKLTCAKCGVLGKAPYTFDFACPTGITEIEHGKAAAILFAMWLVDNPPDVVQQLAAVHSRALQSGDDGDAGTTCPTCGSSQGDAAGH